MREDRSVTNQPAQCAALPYRVIEGVVEVLLVTPRGGDGWIIPKGKVATRLGVRRSAHREAEEEAGVQGEIAPTPFGQYRHGGREDGPLVTVFLMRVTRELSSWAEAHQRDRLWVSLDEVPRRVVDPGLAGVMRDAADHLAIHAPAVWVAAEASRQRARRRLRVVGSAVLATAVLGAAMAWLAG